MGARVLNTGMWFIGADDGSTGYEVVLEQESSEAMSEVEYHTLFKIEPGGDATALGMIIAWADSAVLGGMRWRHSISDPRPKKET